jgi:hypothetical protein
MDKDDDDVGGKVVLEAMDVNASQSPTLFIAISNITHIKIYVRVKNGIL